MNEINNPQQEKKRIKKDNHPAPPFEYGKIPPQNVEMEDAILGAIMLESNAILYVLFLKPEMFYREANQVVFKAILTLKDGNSPIDILTVTQQVKFDNNIKIADAFYITQLTSRVASSSNIQYHARIVYQMFLAREVIRLGSEHTKKAFDPTTDILDLIYTIKENFNNLMNYKHEGKIKKVSEITQQIKHKATSVNLVLETGWKQFDKMVSIENNKFILVGGAAKDGKTRWVGTMMKRLMRKYAKQIKVLWATFEDRGIDIFYNMASEEIFIKPKHIRNNQVVGKEEALEKFTDEFNSFPLEFIEESVTSKFVKEAFITMATENPDKLPILIVDNILTIGDRDNFQKDPNSMYDYVMDQFHQARNLTNGVVIVIHHYKDNQMDKSRVATGFRPEMTDLKGTESFRRIPNHVVLINNPHLRKTLFNEYNGKDKELLRKIFLVDVGANRDDSSDDDDALIRFFHNLDYSIFEEVNAEINY